MPTTQQMLSYMRKGISTYNLISDGDKIAVGVSGGKDSLALLKLLAEYKRFSPEKFDLIAVTVDLCFGGKDGDYSAISSLCEEYGIKYIVEKTQIAEVVFDIRKETNPCALCSKMRKGALHNVAKREGCNKVALGHHADDLIDTLMLSLFYEGRLSTFSPISYLDKIGLTMIRPLVMTKESNITVYAKNLPVVESKCPANKVTKREYVKDVIKDIAKNVPNVRDMIFTAITHPERYNLFDRFIKE